MEAKHMIKTTGIMMAGAILATLALAGDEGGAEAGDRRNYAAGSHGYVHDHDRRDPRTRRERRRDRACYQGFYNQTWCPNSRAHLRYGPLPRDFAFGQGLHILR